LKEIFLTVAGQRRIYTDFPQSHSFTFNIKLLADCGGYCWRIQLNARVLHSSSEQVMVGIWNIDALAVLECMYQS